ncbi:SURF1 family protein [Alteraurantiacibacter palmitatis]|uniref:SURF1-like protein n=1 Tax=Alteraurantiacibacter palmitatis TaxID=2054628 RepID=A0ABV7EAG1_9SPHN
MSAVRRIPVIPTVIVAVAIATMIGLGIWQLGRMQEKEALIARYQAASTSSEALATLPADPLSQLYRRVAFTCTGVTAWNAISGRNARDQAGYVHIATCPDAEVVLGWSRDPSLQPDWAGGEVTGTIAPGGEAGWRIVADPPLAGLEANAAPDPADTPNNHLAYAGQWFFFALSALVIYVLALRKRGR